MIDIIIPAYNAFTTLGRTLGSIAKQVNKDNLKIYIINDGSDTSYDYIIKNYKNVLDITEIMIENSGPGMARQIGIEKSNNEFIFFLDADDTLSNEYSLINLLNIIPGNDLAQGSFNQIFEFNSKILKHQYNYLHGKLYRRSIIEKYNIYFDVKRRENGDIYEDSTFNQLYYFYCKKIATTEEVIDNYVYNPNSITKKKYEKENHLNNYIDSVNWLIKEIENRKIDNNKVISWHVYMWCFHIYYYYLISMENNKNIFKDMKEIKRMYNKYKDDTSFDEQFDIYKSFSDFHVIPQISFYDFMDKIKITNKKH